jgi:hypothetical protein
MTLQHHRDNVIKLLGCAPTREAIQEALQEWEAIAFETAGLRERLCGVRYAVAAGMGGASASGRGRDNAGHPDREDRRRAGATAAARSASTLGYSRSRPRSHPAGPVAGRTLAANGADVMLISSPGLPFIDWLMKDTGRGKLSAYADIKAPDGQAALRRLVKDADIFLPAFRPGALASRGLGPTDVAALRPGIIYVSRSAYGDTGPWASRRGFDSLLQTVSGFNYAEGEAAGVPGPKELPCQAVDHASGYLLAFGALMRACGRPTKRQLAGPSLPRWDGSVDLESGARRGRLFPRYSVARRCGGFAGDERDTIRQLPRSAARGAAFCEPGGMEPALRAPRHACARVAAFC